MFWISSKRFDCCSCSTAAATAAAVQQMQLQYSSCSCSCSTFFKYKAKKAACWIIWDEMHSSFPNLVHKSGLTFWIDLQGCWCSCSCSTAAAAAGLFTDIRLIIVANWIVQKVIYSVRLKLVHNDFWILWIDPKECCWCSCSTTAADVALL